MKQQVAEEISNTYLEVSNTLEDPANTRMLIRKELKKLEQRLINTIMTELEKNINFLLLDYDVHTIRREARKEIKNYLTIRRQEVQKTVKTHIDRIRKSMFSDYITLKKTVVDRGEINEILAMVQNRLLHDEVYSLRSGGSLVRSIRPTVVSEVNRLNQEIPKLIGKLKGIRYARWLLNPNHPFYPYYEICEQYSFETFVEVNKETRELGLEGLHYLDKVPPYPHPHCGCHVWLIDTKIK